jgi:hypothetical protein
MSQPPLIDDTPMAALPLISFRPPPNIQREIDSRGFNWHIHPIEFAAGPVNLDNYRVKILKNPSEKGLDSLEGLLRHIRLNINHFVDPDKVRFAPYDSADGSIWRSDNPLGAVIHIDFGPDWGPANLDDGSVVCSSYSKTHWTFSTVWTSGDFNHPVSGNRQFGYYVRQGPSTPEDGAWIYTRAADRISENVVSAAFMDTIFKGGHDTWLGFQQRVKRFVESKGGKAEVLPAFSARHAWDKMKALHKPTVEWVLKTRHYEPGKRREGELSTRGGPV